MIHAASACALVLGNVILFVPASVGGSLLQTVNNGDVQMYPLGRFPTHFLRALGANALGNNLGELCSWIYQGRTSTWCLSTIRVICVVVGQNFLAGVPLYIKLS